MGQYYKFMNIDKKQRCDRNRGMLKLLEHSYIDTEYCVDILSLLSNEWKGDRILHIGDYAQGGDGTTTSELINKIENDYHLDKCVYDWQNDFYDVEPENVDNSIRFVYNLDKKEYIDLLKQPIQWCWLDKNEIRFSKINSFALLIGCGNEQGGGDYYLANHLQVGSWAGDHFVSSSSLLKEYEDFKENNYIFNEELGFSKNRKKYNEKNEKVILKYEEEYFIKFLDMVRNHNECDVNKLKINSNRLTSNEKKSLTNYFELYKITINAKKDIMKNDEKVLHADEENSKEM